MGYFRVHSVLFNLYLLRLGYDTESVGLTNAVGFLCYALSGLPAGALGSRYGNRRIMIAGLGLSMAMLLPLAQVMPVTIRRPWILATNSIGSMGGAAFVVCGTPYLMAVTSEAGRHHAFSVRMAISPLSGFLGSLVAGSLPGLLASTTGAPLSDPAPYGYPRLLVPLLYALAVLALLGTSESQSDLVRAAPTRGRPAPHGLIALTALIALLQASSEWGARIFFNVYLDTGLGASASTIGVLLALAQLLFAPAALSMPLLASILGRERTILLSSLEASCSLLPLALIPHWAAAGLSLAGVIAMSSVMFSSFLIHCQETFPARWRALASDAFSTATGLSASTMAFVGGQIISKVGYRSFFLVASVLTAAGAGLFWATFRFPKGAAKHATPSM